MTPPGVNHQIYLYTACALILSNEFDCQNDERMYRFLTEKTYLKEMEKSEKCNFRRKFCPCEVYVVM